MQKYFWLLVSAIVCWYIGWDACWFVFKGLLTIFVVVVVLLVALLMYVATLDLPESSVNEGESDYVMPTEDEATKTSR